MRKTTLIDYRLLSDPSIVEHVVFPKLLAKRLDKLLISLLREEYEIHAEDLTFMPVHSGQYVLAVKLANTTIRVDDLGGGARSALLLTAILCVLNNTIVLIEDPEIHQHPAGLGTTMKFLLKVAKERDLQLIMSTQSIELIEIVRRTCEKLGLELRLFYLERHEDGTVDVRTLTSQDVDILKKLGLDPRLLHVL